MTTPPKPKLFAKLRTDPKKVAEGVWITHTDSGDQFLIRRLWCPEHQSAHFRAKQDYEDEHGEGSSADGEGAEWVAAVGVATGLIVDWKLAESDRPYDPAAMAEALADPELSELNRWIFMSASSRDRFRPDHVAGN